MDRKVNNIMMLAGIKLILSYHAGLRNKNHHLSQGFCKKDMRWYVARNSFQVKRSRNINMLNQVIISSIVMHFQWHCYNRPSSELIPYFKMYTCSYCRQQEGVWFNNHKII